MNIIGKSKNSYICEVSKEEMEILTGASEPYGSDRHAHYIGTISNIKNLSDHIKAMERTVIERSKAATMLRAAADIISTVPESFTLPVIEPTKENHNEP